VIASIYQMLR